MTAPGGTADRVHLPALDGIRGIAILLVMFHHFALYSGLRPTVLPDRVYGLLASATWCGVDLFFVLSGFLITGILYDAKGGRGYFRNFYMRRVLRIFPLYYGALVVLFVVTPRLVSMGPGFAALERQQPWYWTYLVNVEIAFRGWPEYLQVGHFWSLAVEEQFYLVWPLVVFLFSRRSLMRICVACAIGAFVARTLLFSVGLDLGAYVLTPARIDALAVGAFLALWVRGSDGVSAPARWIRPALWTTGAALVGIVLVRRGFGPLDPVVNRWGFTLLAVGFGAVIALGVAAPRASRVGRLLASPVLVFFGRYSYALYVFHHPVAIHLQESGFTAASVPPLAGSRLPGALLYAAVAGVISVVLALASWYLWEAPFLRLKRLFPYDDRPPRRAAEGGTGRAA